MVERQPLQQMSPVMSEASEYVVDGDILNKLLEPYNLEAYQPTSELHHMLSGQVFDTLEKKLVKGLLEEIDKAKVQTVRFVNLEALASGPHKDYLYPICAGLVVLIEALKSKNISVTGTIQNPFVLPWHLVAKLNKEFRGLPPPGQTTPT
jgi:hypothetical protein